MAVSAAEAYSDALAHGMAVVMNVSAGITLVLAGVLLWLVRTKSPKLMRNYTPYLVLYTVTCVLVKLMAGACKPVLLMLPVPEPIWVLYSVGWLANTSPYVFAGLTFATVLLLAQLNCCYATLTLERLFALTLRRSRTSLAAALLLTTVCITGGFAVISAIVVGAGAVLLEGEVVAVLQQHMLNTNDFLATHRGALVALHLGHVHYSVKMLFILIFALFGIAGSLPIILTLKIARKYTYLHGTQFRQMNSMLMRASLAQLFGFVIFWLLPAAVFFILVVVLKVRMRFEEVTVAISGLFAVYDMIAIVVVIKPYREALFFCVRTRNVSGGPKTRTDWPKSVVVP